MIMELEQGGKLHTMMDMNMVSFQANTKSTGSVLGPSRPPVFGGYFCKVVWIFVCFSEQFKIDYIWHYKILIFWGNGLMFSGHREKHSQHAEKLALGGYASIKINQLHCLQIWKRTTNEKQEMTFRYPSDYTQTDSLKSLL